MHETVLRRIEEWRKKLLDLSRRNRLINCTVGQRGAIQLVHPSPSSIWDALLQGTELTFVWKQDLVEDEAAENTDTTRLSLYGDEDASDAQEAANEVKISLEQCLASPLLASHHLLTPMSDRVLGGRLSRLALASRTALSEQGVNVLFAAFGFLKWYEPGRGDTPNMSPLLLVPITLERSGATASWKVTLYEEEITPNYCLRESLKRDFRLALPEPDGQQLLESSTARLEYLDLVRAAIQEQAAWAVIDEAVIGQFSFQKLAMYEDYSKNAAEIAQHEHCQRIAGSPSAPPLPRVECPKPNEFDDKLHPATLHTILPCDSSQLEAIVAVKNGASLVLDGPPGTGKSQTIANIIAECLAAGKTVLFVSEKAAALEVVKRRLDDRNLGDFVLDCHSHSANKKDVVAELGRCLALHSENYTSRQRDLDKLHHTRQQLNHYVRAIHTPRSALELRPFEVHGRLAKLIGSPVSQCRIDNVLGVDAGALQDILAAIRSLTDCEDVVTRHSNHPWRGCRLNRFSLTLEDEVRQALTELRRALQQWASPLTQLANEGHCDVSPTLQSARAAIEQIEALLVRPALKAEWFANEPRLIAQSVQRTDQMARDFHESQQACREFRPAAADHLEVIEQFLVELQKHDQVKLIRPPAQPTLRGLESHLATALIDLQDFAQIAESLAIAVNDVITHLTVSVSNVTISHLHFLAHLGQLISQAGPMRESWFEDCNLSELQSFARANQERVNDLRTRREILDQKYHPAAFTTDTLALVSQCDKFQSFWSRLSGSWRSFRRQFHELYRETPPKDAATLLHDARNLRRYLQDESALRAAVAERDLHLLRDKDGNVRWEAVIDGVEALQRLKSTIPISPHLKLALCTEGQINRDALGQAADELMACLDRFQEKEAALRTAVSCAQPIGTPYTKLHPRSYSEWLNEQAAFLRHLYEKLKQVTELFEPGHDLPINALTARLVALKQASSARAQAREVFEPIATIFPQVAAPELHDWRAILEDAHFVLSLYEQYDGAIPTRIRNIITDGPHRAATAAAVSEARQIYEGDVKPRWVYLESLFPVDEQVSTGVILSSLTLAELIDWATQQLNEISSFKSWQHFTEIRHRLSQLNLTAVLEEVLAGRFSVQQAETAFLARFYRLWLDAVYASDDVLRAFRVEEHERLLAEFRELDRLAIHTAVGRIREPLLNDPNRPHLEVAGAPSTSELGILLREVNKKRRHLPLRQLFDRVPNLLLRLKPCLMMSPLAVSTYLESQQLQFDVVIFDEASQVLPWDAIGAVYRGRQLVVAGDQKQLPPTTFFDRLLSDEETDEGDDLGDFESVLDVLCSLGFSRCRLRWHYRSRREPLIAYSNRHFYDNDLVTFPSPDDLDGSTAVALEYVENGRWRAKAGFNPVEARRVAELIVKHFQDTPAKSLGVITLNQRQQLAVLDELARLRQGRPELDEYFAEDRLEPLFVKNLENVQGDERDCIILSVAYGPEEATERVAMRFGPLNNRGGERRLNVAVTRARERILVVSSIRADAIDLSRTNAVGVRLLKAYLEFAERGPQALGTEVSGESGVAESPFEESVADALREHGLDIRHQVGCGGFRIGLAAVHPEVPGRYVLGIECDGVTYHRAATARDRDRIRQEVLEQLGWRIVRIWSTDWIRDPQRQIERVLKAYQEALERPPAPQPVETSTWSDEPIIRIRSYEETSSPGYQSIDDVPDHELKRVIVSLTVRYGTTPRDELVKSAARELGFRRTGSRIQSRILSVIETLLHQGRLQNEDADRISAS